MSKRHPIISVTGSSGAGTTSTTKTFEEMFLRENVTAVFIERDAYHRYNRKEMQGIVDEESTKGNAHFSHFGPEANLLKELAETFRSYGQCGKVRTRHYVHDVEESDLFGAPPGTFTEWADLPENTDLLFYEGLHGAVVTDQVDVA
jgi:phosphoribulokinase